MKTSEIRLGDLALWTNFPAGPRHRQPGPSAVKVEVVAVGVEHEYHTVGSFTSYGEMKTVGSFTSYGEMKTVGNGVLVRSLSAWPEQPAGTEFTCRPGQLWPWEQWQNQWEANQQRAAAARAAREAHKTRIAALEAALGFRVDSSTPVQVTVNLDALERFTRRENRAGR